ncbi:putative ribonuclease H-like domain-containing protein [Tanacetum coccineum]
MCDKKNSIHFTDTECLILSPSFKLLDESQVVLRAPRKDDVYSLDLKNIVPSKGLENQLNHKVKIIRCDHGIEFKNHTMNELCAKKGIKREFSMARTPQQNGVAERKNRTLIEAARTINSKAFRVYNKRTKRVEKNLHIDFLEDQPNVAGTGLDWMFDLDFLTNTKNYIPVSVENQVNVDAVEEVVQTAQEKPSEIIPKDNDAHDLEDVAEKEHHKLTEAKQALKDDLENLVTQEMAAKAMDDATRQAFEEEKKKIASTKRAAKATSINILNTGRPFVSAANTPTGANAGESSFVYLGGQIPIDASTLLTADLPTDPNMPDLEDDSDVFPNEGIFNGTYDDEDVGAETDFNNMDNTIDVSSIPTLRVHKDHPKGQILGNPKSAVQTRGKIQKASSVQQALVEAMQEELLQFKLQKVWVLVDLPYGKKVIGTKWVFKNKRDERSIVVKNKARLVAQRFRHEEEEVYVQQPPRFVDPAHLNKVYKMIKALYGLPQTPRVWYETLSSFLLANGFRRGTIDKTLFIKKNKSEIMLVQVYADDIIFGSTTQSMCTEFEDCMHKRFQISSMGELTFFLGLQLLLLIESNKPLVKDEDGVDVDVHIYRFQVTPKASHINAVKQIFRYLKHQPKLGLWYPKDSPFELEAFSNSDYRGASLDKKSTTSGCQFIAANYLWASTMDTESDDGLWL